MTLDDARAFFDQADALSWKPHIIIIGGEPTLHPEFMEFVALARSRTDREIQIFSNAHRPEARELIELARAEHSASLVKETWKPAGSVERAGDKAERDWSDDVYLSPADHGLELRIPCFAHSSEICGISIDHEGYSPCAMGGAIDALLGLGVRTKVLADLFDPQKYAAMTAALCEHCGWRMEMKLPDMPKERQLCHGTPMSRTWRKAFEGRK
jgi:hypothetical protein